MTPRCLTVLDMVTLFDLPELTMLLFRLTLVEQKYREHQEGGAGNRMPTQGELEMLKKLLNDILAYGQRVGFKSAAEKAASVWTFLVGMNERFDSSALSIEMTNMHSALAKDIYAHKFILVSAGLADYLDMQMPLGQEVFDAFPSARSDLVHAGNCLALACTPAVPYHLMRAAEVGLWELGRDRQIPLAQNNKIEFAQWGEIIGELEKAVAAIQQWPNSRLKEEAHKFYNPLLVELRAFNDGWRRHSAHARPYQPEMESDEAIALWGHVSRFMKSLASKIGEGKYTPVIWT